MTPEGVAFLNPRAIKTFGERKFQTAAGVRDGSSGRAPAGVFLALLSGDAGHGAKLAIIIAVVLAGCLLCMLCFVSADPIGRTLGRT